MGVNDPIKKKSIINPLKTLQLLASPACRSTAMIKKPHKDAGETKVVLYFFIFNKKKSVLKMESGKFHSEICFSPVIPDLLGWWEKIGIKRAAEQTLNI